MSPKLKVFREHSYVLNMSSICAFCRTTRWCTNYSTRYTREVNSFLSSEGKVKGCACAIWLKYRPIKMERQRKTNSQLGGEKNFVITSIGDPDKRCRFLAWHSPNTKPQVQVITAWRFVNPPNVFPVDVDNLATGASDPTVGKLERAHSWKPASEIDSADVANWQNMYRSIEHKRDSFVSARLFGGGNDATGFHSETCLLFAFLSPERADFPPTPRCSAGVSHVQR